MKKLLLLALLPTFAFADAFSPGVIQRNATDNATINRFMPVPASNALFLFNTATVLPEMATLGSNLSYSGGVLSAVVSAQQNSDWNAVSGVTQILNKPTNVSAFTNDASYVNNVALAAGLATKYNIPTGTTAEYIRGDGSIATLPVQTYNQSAQTRTLNTIYQVSATRPALVNYSVRIVTTASIGGNQDGDVILEIASNAGFTTNVQTVSITQNAQAITLAVVLNSVQTQTGLLSGFVPAGYYVRLRTVNNTGTPTFTYRAGQEVLL